jgi:hypothetical protein
LANVILGMIYTSYGIMTLLDMKRGWRTMGFSHFGAAWIAMAFTCGPHHLDHGAHMLITGRQGSAFDFAAVLVGAPAGLAWFLLRVEAFRGGRGDRYMNGTPFWLKLGPTAAGIYVTALVVAMANILSNDRSLTAITIPSILLLVLYCTIGYYLLRTQFRNFAAQSRWSLSGLSLGVVFPTCAAMHIVMASYASAGVYDVDIHMTAIDWLSVPAAIYFLWVVRALYRDAIRDWNTTQTATATAVAFR